MQHLEVSVAVRPLKWSLGVKWLRNSCVKCNYIVYRKPPPMDHSLSQIYPIGIIAPYLCTIQSDIIPHSCQGLQSRYRQSN